MDEFYQKTHPEFYVITCTYRNRRCNYWRRQKWRGWHYNITRLGYCLNFRPPVMESHIPQGDAQLAVTIAYNKSDLALGWQHSKTDFTVFISNCTVNPNRLPALSMHSTVKVVNGMNTKIELVIFH